MSIKILNYATEFLQSLRFVDFIDIGVIAILIYLILVWLKKARVRLVLVGMIILGLIYILARFFGLYLTTMVFQAFFAIFLIMIVVIFQDDLRHFFERIAVIGVTRRHRAVAPFAQNTEMLSSALADLSRKKMGALIVIRGTDPLDRHLEAGVVVDALISQVLLESIFDRHAPSHDGATIIDGARITKLGCHLPLSTNIKSIGRLGTRHAAALGITERTDALSLVVSEEEGTISVADEGRIRHLKDITQINNTLQDFYLKKFPQKKNIGIKRFLAEHFIEKVIAVIIACSLWMTFGHRVESIRRDFVVPIEYRNLASNRIINEPTVKEVAVTLSGDAQGFNLFKPAELKVSLDMAKIKDGENKIPLSKDLVRTSSGISVVNIDPGQILLNSYTLIPHTIALEIATRGKPPSGVVIRDIRIEPRSLSVMVPSTSPKDKFNITMEPIELTAVRETTTVIPKLIVDPDIRFSGDKAPEIKVIIDVEKKETEKKEVEKKEAEKKETEKIEAEKKEKGV